MIRLVPRTSAAIAEQQFRPERGLPQLAVREPEIVVPLGHVVGKFVAQGKADPDRAAGIVDDVDACDFRFFAAILRKGRHGQRRARSDEDRAVALVEPFGLLAFVPGGGLAAFDPSRNIRIESVACPPAAALCILSRPSAEPRWVRPVPETSRWAGSSWSIGESRVSAARSIASPSPCSGQCRQRFPTSSPRWPVRGWMLRRHDDAAPVRPIHRRDPARATFCELHQRTDHIAASRSPSILRGKFPRIGRLHRRREQAIGNVLIADRPQEPHHRQRSDRSRAPVRCRRIRPAVDHGVGDFDTGGPAIGQYAAGLGCSSGRSLRRALHRLHPSAASRSAGLRVLRSPARLRRDRRNARSAPARRTLRCPALGRRGTRRLGLKQGAGAAVAPSPAWPARDRRAAALASSAATPAVVGVDSGAQHDRRLGSGQRVGGGVDERSRSGAVDRNHQAGIGAELPGAQRQRADESRAQRLGARGQRGGQQDNRVDAAHLGIDRNRLGASRRRFPPAPVRRRASR